tara:strand:+ start:19 stop:159 length:141 start_codon:yes stop_codon:yes gene_type:complete
MSAVHEYTSPEEHMEAMKAKMEAIFKAEEDACMTNVQVTQEDMAQF